MNRQSAMDAKGQERSRIHTIKIGSQNEPVAIFPFNGITQP
jgi:hypothetical protein